MQEVQLVLQGAPQLAEHLGGKEKRNVGEFDKAKENEARDKLKYAIV